MKTEQTFDYIVVGAGATGCVLANRLSADSRLNVLLVEAGVPDTDPRIHSLNGFVQLWGGDLDWKFTTPPQPGLNGRQIVINQGKVYGGGSSIHALMYVRGNRRNFDQWSAQGCDGWSYADVLPYFKMSENFEGGASEYHGVGGPLHVRICPDPAADSPYFRQAAVELGYQGPNWDYNAAQQEDGSGNMQFNVTPDGKRCSTATAFLAPALGRPNLTVLSQAETNRVIFDGKRAVGVEYVQSGQTLQARATREVILSASAFVSPKLLMLSGIGPAASLKAHGIPVLVDLPGVGQNLHDHLQLPMIFKSTVESPAPDLLAGNIMFTNTRQDKKNAPPNLQLISSPNVPSALAAMIPVPTPASIVIAILVQPESRGTVTLHSANPQDPPVVDPHFLEDPADVQVYVEALKLIRSLAATKAYAPLNVGEMAPGANADLEAYARNGASTIWHPVGTCKMGKDAMAVVDPQLKVFGVEGLRVADASVMPIVPSGNTFAGCVMIGEKLADQLLKSV